MQRLFTVPLLAQDEPLSRNKNLRGVTPMRRQYFFRTGMRCRRWESLLLG